MQDIINNIAAKVPKDDNTYTGDDGLLHCRSCGGARQTKVSLFGKERIVGCICPCLAEKRDKENQRLQADEIERKRRVCFSQSNMHKWTFETDDKGNPKLSEAMQRYVENFRTFLKEGKGLLLYGTVGTGKALTIDTDIITPYGKKKMKDIHVNDEVIGWDGKPCRVIGEYPQGEKEVYKITFEDGTAVKCCEEHLWIYKTPHSKNKKWQVATLGEMLAKHTVKGANGFTMAIPKAEATEYNLKPNLKIEPYVLGALLGDGGMTGKQVTFTNTEEDVCEMVFDGLAKFEVAAKKHTEIQYLLSAKKGRRNQLRKTLGEYGLAGCRSEAKFIPQDYLYASVEERKALLAGIFDTDGSISQNGSKSISTSSKQMTDDILQLCRSLGYRCTVRKPDTRHKHTNYTIGVQTKEKIYRSQKHAQKDKPKTSVRKKDYMSIVNIEKCGVEECKCIAVDNKTSSYLCGDFIVTHNTFYAACIANALIDKEYRVLMTNFASLTNTLQGKFEGKQEYINSLNNYSLLIIDDLGAERKSEFMQEQVFNIIDSRYRAGLPMIITTNLTINEIKKPSEIGNARIYDRILERCHPVEVTGSSRRRRNVKDTYTETQMLLGLGD